MFAGAFLFEGCPAVQLAWNALQEGNYNESTDKILFTGRKIVVD